MEIIKKVLFTILILTLGLAGCKSHSENSTMDPYPGSAELPLWYDGPGLLDPEAPDGKLMYTPGVQSIQINRANRKYPPVFPDDPENVNGWTYQHHVDLGLWNGLLYAVWDITPTGEDNPPTRVLYSTSSDGFNWSEPNRLFPMDMAFHSRFYFYHASNGRMLTFAAGAYPTENISETRKETLLVREIMPDHQLGEVYTLIKPGPNYPHPYTESNDTGFVAACLEAYNHKPLLEQADYGLLLGDRRMKWHDPKNWPGGELPEIGNSLWVPGKASCFFSRADGNLVGVAKSGFVTLSEDQGEIWSLPVIPEGIVTGGGKVWAQRTPDDRYAMFYTPQQPGPRYPMIVVTSDDGITFRDMRVVNGDVPPTRYVGRGKDPGLQYFRGVAEWAGDAATIDTAGIWVIYSMNKEDIWVSRISVPIRAEAEKHVRDDFDNHPAGSRVPGWNTYSPTWTTVGIAKDQTGNNQYLKLEDREPVDYARAIRTFPQSNEVEVSFSLAAAQNDRGLLEIDLLGEDGTRPVQIILNDQGNIQYVDGGQPVVDLIEQGLAGTFFKKPDLTDPELMVDILTSLDHEWGRSRGGDWSARWNGYLEGPHTGDVTFHAKATDGLRLKVDDHIVIDGLLPDGERTGKVTMQKGKKTPVTLEFTSARGLAELRLAWSWQGQGETIIPSNVLSYSQGSTIKPLDLTPYNANEWKDIKINVNCSTGTYSLYLNGREVVRDALFAEPSSMVYAVSFRTGEFRPVAFGWASEDIHNTEEPMPPVVYRIDNVMTGN